MQVTVCIRWTIIVDNDVDTFDVDTTAEDISGHENTLLEGFKGSISIDSGFRVIL